jgi:hypothetical protein
MYTSRTVVWTCSCWLRFVSRQYQSDPCNFAFLKNKASFHGNMNKTMTIAMNMKNWTSFSWLMKPVNMKTGSMKGKFEYSPLSAVSKVISTLLRLYIIQWMSDIIRFRGWTSVLAAAIQHQENALYWLKTSSHCSHHPFSELHACRATWLFRD